MLCNNCTAFLGVADYAFKHNDKHKNNKKQKYNGKRSNQEIG